MAPQQVILQIKPKWVPPPAAPTASLSPDPHIVGEFNPSVLLHGCEGGAWDLSYGNQDRLKKE